MYSDSEIKQIFILHCDHLTMSSDRLHSNIITTYLSLILYILVLCCYILHTYYTNYIISTNMYIYVCYIYIYW